MIIVLRRIEPVQTVLFCRLVSCAKWLSLQSRLQFYKNMTQYRPNVQTSKQKKNCKLITWASVKMFVCFWINDCLSVLFFADTLVCYVEFEYCFTWCHLNTSKIFKCLTNFFMCLFCCLFPLEAEKPVLLCYDIVNLKARCF